MKADQLKPTEAELEILQALWEKGPCTVRQVHEHLCRRKETGYTTTLKIMQIMTEKGLLKRDETQRTHVYHANVEEKDVKRQLLDRFLETVFGGSATALVMHALGNKQPSLEELQQIRQLIDQIEKGGAQ
ncbi:MAG: BlaI/MecI/CopY family transcriptional regulator [Cytophagales bacterium]|nr:BlaI/MecI/CopY family transcriptional regulator [Bernardetiaceae bacterium]MDW8210279.1 BlaI/MecI/CopY family transcriptional regulator [Cytophagales bacterium]